VAGALGPVVPVSFAESVRRRLKLLEARGVEIVQLAASLGRAFDWKLVSHAAGLDDEHVLEQLHRAVDAQILVVDRQGFRFRHALTRQAVLDALSGVQRARQAARLLDAVEAAHPHLDDASCELAAGLAETAGDRARAAGLLLELGRNTLAQGALRTAESILDRA